MAAPANPNPNITPTIAVPGVTPRRVPPPCWSTDETLALIDAYRDKWYSLRRGNLKASQWQDVADSVLRRCGGTKTAVQCRHKIEKLRKRYRSERQRALRFNPNSKVVASSWVFFKKMETLELGSDTGGIPSDSGSVSLSEDDDGYNGGRNRFGLTPNGIGHESALGSASGSGTKFKFKIPKAMRTSKVGLLSIGYPSPDVKSGSFRDHTPKPVGFDVEEMRRNLERKKRKEREEGGGGMGEIVAAIRMLGDGFMRMEQMKMDMTREIHNLRMEMELKHTEMILDTQHRIVDAFLTGIVGKKKSKMSSGL